MKKLIIVGLGETACIAYEYFQLNTDVPVVGFAVNEAYHRIDTFQNLPVHILENLVNLQSNSDLVFFVALSGGKCNQDRTNVFNFVVNSLKLNCINFVSKFSHIATSCNIGVNNLIMEMSSLQYNVQLGSNCIIWNGVQICHSSIIGDNVYLAPGSIVCGFCKIGDNTYIGTRVTIIDNITIGSNCFISAGVLIKRDVPDNTLVRSNGDYVLGIDISKFDNNNFYDRK
ncbi:MAG: acetyltransferase [Burkholderiales bacterium]|nr:acetyltransferase [Burkholderiales bacterium]